MAFRLLFIKFGWMLLDYDIYADLAVGAIIE